MKKTISMILTLALALTLALSLTACGGNSNTGSTGGNNSTPGTAQGADNTPSGNSDDSSSEWAGYKTSFELTRNIPEPNGVITFSLNNNDKQFFAHIEWTIADAKQYREKLEAAGFVVTEEDDWESGGTYYLYAEPTDDSDSRYVEIEFEIVNDTLSSTILIHNLNGKL